MAKSINELLGGIDMTTAAQAVKLGLPDLLPPSFARVTRRVVGNTVKYFKIAEGGRNTARLVQYGSPSVLVGKTGFSEEVVKLLHSFEQQTHDPLALQNLLNPTSPDSGYQQLAVSEIARQTEDFMTRYNNLRGQAVYSALVNGKIWFDSGGNLLYSSAGATTTIDYGIPATNTGTMTGWTGGTVAPIVTTSWATSGADIVGNIKTIKRTARRRTGYPIKYAFYGENIAGYIANNTRAKEYIAAVPNLANQAYTGGEIPDGFLGLTWVPLDQAFGVDATGTVRDLWGPDTIVFSPEPSPDWWEVVEGSFLVPTTFNPQPGVVSAARSVATVFGKFSYAKVTDDPINLVQLAGDTFIPLLKVPAAVFVADVTP